jgi:hypothetical protein
MGLFQRSGYFGWMVGKMKNGVSVLILFADTCRGGEEVYTF